jgi:hypothetical protein
MKNLMMMVVGGFAFAGLAGAAITPALVGSPTVSGANFVWNYQISVDSLEQLTASSSPSCSTAAACGSFFTIYDFVGYVAGSIKAPTGWATQVALKGLTNSTQNPTDSATLSNLTFIYVGTPNPNVGPLNLAGFSAASNFGTANNGGTFTYQAEKDNGTIDAGIGPIEVPSASCDTDTFEVNYYSNAHNTPDGTVRITNVGTQIGSTGDSSGDMCALVYVLTPDQELSECCACAITPDGLLTLSVNNDLTSNPLTREIPVTGDIKIISSKTCNPAAPSPAPAIRAWATHIQNNGSVTETPFTNPSLCTGEIQQLASKCSAILSNGSGFGVCSCGGINGI